FVSLDSCTTALLSHTHYCLHLLVPFFFSPPAPHDISTLSLHDALPICTVYCLASDVNGKIHAGDLLTTSSIPGHAMRVSDVGAADRKSTRLNSSHQIISYAVFCLKKKKKEKKHR